MEKFTRNVNIFDKDFIIVPLHDAAHWMVAVICYPYICMNPDIYDDPDNKIAPCILRFDSMPKHSDQVFNELRSYLTYAHRLQFPNENVEFTAKTIKAKNVKVPEQANCFDCGIFLLTYVEWFFKNPLENFKSIKNLEKWFDESETREKRRAIAMTIKNLVSIFTPGHELYISCLKSPSAEADDERSDGSPVKVVKKRSKSKRLNFESDDEDWTPWTIAVGEYNAKWFRKLNYENLFEI